MNATPPLNRKALAATALIVTFGTLSPLPAADFIWTGKADGDWSELANWSGGSWIPGTDFPTSYDTVLLGTEGFAPYVDGSGSETRNVTLHQNVRLQKLEFEQFGNDTRGLPFNYTLSGTGKLIFGIDSSSQSSLQFGGAFRDKTVVPNHQPGNSEINTDIDVVGTLTISGHGQGQARSYYLNGNVRSADATPIHLSLIGGGNNAAIIFRGADNDFSGGSVRLNAALRANIHSNSFRNANVYFSGTANSLKAIVVNSSDASDANRDTVAKRTDYQMLRTVVEENGLITLNSDANYHVGWSSIEINAGKKLTIDNGNNSIFFIEGAGKKLSLGTGAEFVIHQNRSGRFTKAQIGKGALVEGNGLLTTTPLNSSGGNNVSRIEIASDGIIDPGIGAGQTGILSYQGLADGSTGHSAASLDLLGGSTLRMQLNGLVAGTGHDQLRITVGTFRLFETDGGVTLSLSVGAYYAPTDRLVLIDIADTGTTFTGQFAGLDEGAIVNLGLFEGEDATARISYLGLNGLGNDVILYDFQMVAIPEPGTYLLLGCGIGILALYRKRRR